MPVAMISGCGGQDGSYLAEFLLTKGYEVHGLVRPSGTPNLSNLSEVMDKVILHRGDITDFPCMVNLIREIQPDEIYHLAGMTQVRWSFDEPVATMNATGLGTVNLLHALITTRSQARFYQASSSEIFGNSHPPQSELTPINPRSPYGVAKACAHWTVRNYRDGYNLYAANGILFNHESPRRGEAFVTRKITKAVAEIVAGKRQNLLLGYIDSKRDWGYAPDYVRAMWQMLQMDLPDDYVIGTGEVHSVRELLEEAFGCVDLDWHDYVTFDTSLYRPTEIYNLRANPQKARDKLGWEPTVTFKELVRIMVEADMKHEQISSVPNYQAS